MRQSLRVLALFSVCVLWAGHGVVMAQRRAVTTTLDIPVSDTVTITIISSEGAVDTIPLSGEVSLLTTVVPPNPIRVSARVSLSGVSEDTATCYLVQGGSTVRPTDPYIPGDPHAPTDPYQVLFTTRLIALRPVR